MWFDEIMDDCKQALITANNHKGIFIPIFVKLALSIALIIYIVVAFVAVIFRNQYMFEYLDPEPYMVMNFLSGLTVNFIIIYLLVLIGFSIIDVGSLNMFKAALNDQKPGFKDFKEGVKHNLFKVILGKLLLHLLAIITLPITALLFVLYAVLVGVPTAGWGFLFLGVFISVYLGTWITIVVVEGNSTLEAIWKSIRLGRRYFKGLFVILLASTLISSYSTAVFGVLAAVLGGWLIAGAVATYFRLIVMLVYYRNRESL